MEGNKIFDLIHSQIDMSLGLYLLVGTLFTILNVFLGAIFWYGHYGRIKEVGYPRRNEKFVKRRYMNKGWLDNLFLYTITKKAENVNLLIYLNFLSNFALVLCTVSAVVGYLIGLVQSIFSMVGGWVFVSIFSPFLMLILGTAIMFIPDLIWWPAERRRYFGGRKKK